MDAWRGLVLGLGVLLTSAATAGAGPVLNAVPSQPDPAQRYLIYLHGQVVEELGPNARTPEGRSDYSGILQALADKGFAVIAEIRPAQSNIGEYGDKVAKQVRDLLASGVPASNVYVSGFSKGGVITLAASAKLANPDLKFVVMAGCGRGPREAGFRQTVERLGPQLKGRVLSIYDAGDGQAGSCADLFAKAGTGFAGEEKVLHVGAGHGLFYGPRSEWVNAVTEWLLH